MSEWKYTLVYDLVLRDHVTSAERIRFVIIDWNGTQLVEKKP